MADAEGTRKDWGHRLGHRPVLVRSSGTRLFLRISRQDPLSRVTLASWLADGPPGAVAQSMVMFFGGVNRSIKVIECDPAAFASELARHWRERHPSPVSPTDIEAWTGPRGLVFISYAREDEVAARSLADGLKARGCDVYFDRERLGTGMNFHFQLEDQVRKYCGLFLSVISPATECAVGDNYFRRERYWASQRAEGYSDAERGEFYLPVLIHPTVAPFPRSGIWPHIAGGAAPSRFARPVRGNFYPRPSHVQSSGGRGGVSRNARRPN